MPGAWVKGAAVVVVMAAFALLSAPPALAGNFTVNSLGDGDDVNPSNGTCDAGGGACTLRAASQEATSAGDDTITITAEGTIDVATPLHSLTDHVNVTGPGADRLTIRRSAGSFPLFRVLGGETLALSGVKLTKSPAASPGSPAGAISLETPTSSVGLDFIAITGESGVSAGAIANLNGYLWMGHSLISSNTGGVAGGFYADGETATVVDVTFTGNTATGVGATGGAIYTAGSQVGIFGATVAGNTSAASTAANLLFDTGSIVRIRDSIFADPLGGPGRKSCQTDGGTLSSLGFNLDEDATCNTTAATDIRGVDPALQPLAANGGSTLTQAILPTSPAVDKASISSDGFDQRRFPRPSDFLTIPNAIGAGGADIGAYEVTAPLDRCAGKKGKSRKRCLCKQKKKKKKRKKCLKKLKGKKD